MTSAAQTLDLQADLMVRLTDPKWLEVMREQTRLDMDKTEMRTGKMDKAAMYAAQIVDRLHEATRRASAYYVDPKMTGLVEFASMGLDESDKVRLDLLPTDFGFAYFPNPLQLIDIHGTALLINAVLWFRVDVRYSVSGKELHPGVMVCALNDADVTPDKVTQEIIAKGYSMGNGRWHLVGTQFIPDGMHVGPSRVTPGADDLAIYPEEELSAYTNIVRLMHSYWLLMNQEVTDLSEADVPRAFAKRARKMEIPDRVTIVALRRYAGQSHSEHVVEWQHRWMVRGHWAWRACSEHHDLAEPKDDGSGWHARVWIRAHIKGPDDKEFVLTEKVYALVR